MVREFDERNMAKSRAVCAAMAEEADTGKRRLTERERRILDMWPRFEDGEPVMIGDGVDGLGGEIIEMYIAENTASIWNNCANHMHLSPGERVKRPAPEVLDADGVEIKVGDTVYDVRGERFTVTDIEGGLLGLSQDGFIIGSWMPADQFSISLRDSWERLEEDAESIRQTIARNFGDFSPSDFKQSGDSLQDRVSDIVRRAKALAGVKQ